MKRSPIFSVKVGARASPLSRVQVDEVLQELTRHSTHVEFECTFLETTGDKDLQTSLRTLDKTDFFTREVDALLLSRQVQIGIHSAKDLPDPLPKGLRIVALTNGVDPSDSLVMRPGERLESLPQGAVIATSSFRREEIVKQLRPDLRFIDIRGPIGARLEKLERGEADGVVIAEAALLRLQLTHLNRVKLPGETVPFQGQLAIIAREDDHEMALLFLPLDSRQLNKSLYLGPEPPLYAFNDRWLVHFPLIQMTPKPINDLNPFILEWDKFTHLIFTSKTSVKLTLELLKAYNIPESTLASKQLICIGEATAKGLPVPSLLATPSTSEGIVHLLNRLNLEEAYIGWPHSSLSRPVIAEFLKKKGLRFFEADLYEPTPKSVTTLPPLRYFKEIIFSSPSTVSAFFALHPYQIDDLSFTPIGPITADSLAEYIET